MLELYQAEDCPNSEQVREKLLDLGASYVIHNPRTKEGAVRNERTREDLRKLGGEDQIPYLVDTDRGEALYDSDDIVAYLDEYYG